MLSAKLEHRGFDSAVVKAVISSLLEQNLLNDERYAELWIRSRLASGRASSPLWLLSALVKRGISRESSLRVLNKALDPETEHALLCRYMEKSRFPKGKRALSPRTLLKYEGFSSRVLDIYFDA